MLLSLVFFCRGLSAQTTPAFSFSLPQKVLVGASAKPGRAYVMTAIDINKDGNPDLVGHVYYVDASGNLSGGGENDILMGDGKGGFILTKSNIPSTALGHPFVDANRDGYPDVIDSYDGYYIFDPENGCQGQVDGFLSVDLGDGMGNFRSNGFSVGVNPFTNASTVIGDFNQDGLPDIAMLTFSTDECAASQSFLYVLLNNGDGTFTSQGSVSGVPIFIGWGATNLVKGDFDGDGKPDLAFIGSSQDSIQVLHGNGDGSFHEGLTYKVDTQVYQMLAADLNNDGRTDLVIYANAKSVPNAQGRIVTLLGEKSGGFSWYSELAISQSPVLVGLLDLNNDGKPDLPYYTYDSATKITSLRVYPGLGGGKFGASWLVRNLAPNEMDVFAPLKAGGPLDIFYSLSYPPNKNIYLYEILNQSK